MHEIFYDELRKLNVRFMEMGINVSEQIYRSTKSFIDMTRNSQMKSSTMIKRSTAAKFSSKIRL